MNSTEIKLLNDYLDDGNTIVVWIGKYDGGIIKHIEFFKNMPPIAFLHNEKTVDLSVATLNEFIAWK